MSIPRVHTVSFVSRIYLKNILILNLIVVLHENSIRCSRADAKDFKRIHFLLYLRYFPISIFTIYYVNNHLFEIQVAVVFLFTFNVRTRMFCIIKETKRGQPKFTSIAYSLAFSYKTPSLITWPNVLNNSLKNTLQSL